MCLRALPGGVRAEGINTEHQFGFMIGRDIGNVGELPEPDYRAICQEWRKLTGDRPGIRIGIRALGIENHLESHAKRIDKATAAVVRSYRIEFTLAFYREVIPNVAVATLNLV